MNIFEFQEKSIHTELILTIWLGRSWLSKRIEIVLRLCLRNCLSCRGFVVHWSTSLDVLFLIHPLKLCWFQSIRWVRTLHRTWLHRGYSWLLLCFCCSTLVIYCCCLWTTSRFVKSFDLLREWHWSLFLINCAVRVVQVSVACGSLR